MADETPYHEADLTKGMEHMRPYVSVPASSAPANRDAGQDGDEPATTYGIPTSVINPAFNQKRRDRSPSNKEKRQDPFQFGSRYLEEGDDVFEFNAWDHVELDEGFKAFAEEQYERQRNAPVNEQDREKIMAAPAKAWDKFYKNNTSKFFKNRKWLFQEFPVLTTVTANSSETDPDASPNTHRPNVIVELGAGAGNTVFPILELNQNPNLHIHALDFSSRSISLIKDSELYTKYHPQHLSASVWDLASPKLPSGLEPGGVDVVIMIFVFSALAPSQWAQALRNVWTIVKPGGEVLFRDYGKGDLAQVRFRDGRWLEESFYARGDGTRVYFFEEEELRKIWSGTHESLRNDNSRISNVEDGTENTGTGPSTNDESNDMDHAARFEILNLASDRRMLVNRKRKLKMYRCWMQGRFRKPFVS